MKKREEEKVKWWEGRGTRRKREKLRVRVQRAWRERGSLGCKKWKTWPCGGWKVMGMECQLEGWALCSSIALGPFFVLPDPDPTLQKEVTVTGLNLRAFYLLWPLRVTLQPTSKFLRWTRTHLWYFSLLAKTTLKKHWENWDFSDYSLHFPLLNFARVPSWHGSYFRKPPPDLLTGINLIVLGALHTISFLLLL